MGQAPVGLAGITKPAAQKKCTELLLGFTFRTLGIFTGTAEIPHGFILQEGHIHGGQFSCSMQSGQHLGIPPIVLDAVTALFRDQGRRDDNTVKPLAMKVSVNLISTGAGFIDKAELSAPGNQFANQFLQRTEVATIVP